MFLLSVKFRLQWGCHDGTVFSPCFVPEAEVNKGEFMIVKLLGQVEVCTIRISTATVQLEKQNKWVLLLLLFSYDVPQMEYVDSFLAQGGQANFYVARTEVQCHSLKYDIKYYRNCSTASTKCI